MAGSKIKDEFKELVSPFLKHKMEELKKTYGEESREYQAVSRQYITDPSEKDIVDSLEVPRHYQSEVKAFWDNKPLQGVERLYKKTVLLEPTTVCAAHCRWCLRGQYPVKTMKKDDISNATKYIGADERKENLTEVLLTGGDPLMSLPLLDFTLEEIKKNASNIKIIRVASRVPFQDPERINEKMLEIFSKYKNFKFELGTHINHAVEFWKESVESLERLQSIGFRIYNQNPLLKNVNDDFNTLSNLYTALRENDIESHYLFHAIPLRGMNHHRTSVQKGIDLTSALSSSGEFSGRAKPRFCILSDIGKIVLYHNTIVDRRKSDNAILLKSGFNINSRLQWNTSWKKPDSVELDEDGTMFVWYLDATDEQVNKKISKEDELPPRILFS
jgi:lysine 2,3-aminomutase